MHRTETVDYGIVIEGELVLIMDEGETTVRAGDIVVQRGDKLIYCGGALAQLYETLGGKVVMAGKPHAPIYELCVAEAERLTDGPVARSRMLCIGDGVATDVKGANAQGLDVLFIAAGIHGGETITPEGLDAAAVESLLRQEGAQARWAMADLTW
jgi:ribonucleotide monophosphatase NagD (HAD superfamily)